MEGGVAMSDDRVAARRAQLLEWMHKSPENDGLTAMEMATLSGLYSRNGRDELCMGDLKTLAEERAVSRTPGRPARWWVRD
jgi:hypothetical protein